MLDEQRNFISVLHVLQSPFLSSATQFRFASENDCSLFIERTVTMKKIACILIVFACILCIHTSSFADSVNLPAGLVEVKEEAFYGNTSITEVRVPEGTTTIGPRAFSHSGLRKIYLPASVNSIDSTAFNDLTQNFMIVAPKNSYSYQYAISHHYSIDIKESFTIESAIGDNFMVESIIDYGQDILVICSVLPEYSDENGYTSFVLGYGIQGNQIISEAISLEDLKQGYTFSFSKAEIGQHNIPPIITLYADIKDTYTKKSDIGDNFLIKSIIDYGQDILVICSVLSEYSDENGYTSFVLGYGIPGNQIISEAISLHDLKQGYTYSISKNRTNQHGLPPVISLYADIKDSYSVESDIGDNFVLISIIDDGRFVLVRCSVILDYSTDENTKFTLCYGVIGNCIYRRGISLEDLKKGFIADFSKEVINQHHIPSVIMLCIE